LSASRRFLENPEARQRCTAYVQENGGTAFFARPGWEKALAPIVEQVGPGEWESAGERRIRFQCDLGQARERIEARLRGARVRVLALPWGEIHPELPSIARETGHELLVLGYPLPVLPGAATLPVHMRLYGDAIWTLLDGPVVGGVRWWRARRSNLARKASGAVP
jgi:hypothetical protein